MLLGDYYGAEIMDFSRYILGQLVVILLLLILPQSNSRDALAFPEKKLDLMYMIDVSGSMIGHPSDPGAKDIFPKVMEALKRHIETLSSNTRVFIFTFADGPFDVDGPGIRYRSIWEKDIMAETEESDKEEIKKYIGPLNEDIRHRYGRETAIYDAMRIALQKFDELRKTYERENPNRSYRDSHIQKIILFTDGRDTHSVNWDFETFLREFQFRRAEDVMGNYFFIRIVALREDIFTERERKAIKEQPGIQIVEGEIIIEPPSFSIIPSKVTIGGLTKGTTKRERFTVKAENLAKAKALDISVKGINRELIDATLTPSTIVLMPDRHSISFVLEIRAKKNLSWWRSSKAKIIIQDPGKAVAEATIKLKGAFPWKAFSVIGSVLILVLILSFTLPLILQKVKESREKLPPSFELKPEDFPVRIGRKRRCERGENKIPLWHSSVSLCHAEIAREESRYLIKKIEGSLYVNGNSIDEKEIKNGDEVGIGDFFKFKVTIEKEGLLKLMVSKKP
ncbi:MAG TPA: VWA domain-containing protein [Candidatus Korarchaeota archaeon]|nr:VWA domain-containing protein [Candidatus Korarchaeota archaeon]